jgi:hypothetical protein
LGEASLSERARLFAVALEGLSDHFSANLENRVSDAKWRALKKDLRAMLQKHGLDMELVGELKAALVRPTLSDQLGAIIDGLAAVQVEVPLQYDEELKATLVTVRNSLSHRRAGQPPVSAEAVRTAAEQGERLFRASGLTILPIHAASRRRQAERILKGEVPLSSAR